MKKLFIVLILAVAASGAFAVPEFTIGGGIGFNIVKWSGGYTIEEAPYNYGPPPSKMEVEAEPFEGFVFVDATYFEFTLGYSQVKYTFSAPMLSDDYCETYTAKTFNLGAFFKYPFELGPFTLYLPILGMEFLFEREHELNITGVKPDYFGTKQFVSPWGDDSRFGNFLFKIGGGFSFDFGGPLKGLYLRATSLFCVRGEGFEKGRHAIGNDSSVEGKKDPLIAWDVVQLVVGFRFNPGFDPADW